VTVQVSHSDVKSFRKKMVDSVQNAAQLRHTRINAAPVLAHDPKHGGGVTGKPRGDRAAYLVKREIQGTQQVHKPGLRDLVGAVAPVAGHAVDAAGGNRPIRS
jgi:hypothetical protein